MTSAARPTESWLAASPLPPLEGAEGVAERIVLLVHYGVDFTVWGGVRRARYWPALEERVKAATYAGPKLADWWSDITQLLTSSPRNAEERAELAELLQSEDQKAILAVLRKHAEVLVLRVRVISEHRKRAGGAE